MSSTCVELEIAVSESSRSRTPSVHGTPGATDGDSVMCERTQASADLQLSSTELGAVFLGGTTLASLAAAGRVYATSIVFPFLTLLKSGMF